MILCFINAIVSLIQFIIKFVELNHNIFSTTSLSDFFVTFRFNFFQYLLIFK